MDEVEGAPIQAMPVIRWIQRTIRLTQSATTGSHTAASIGPAG